MLELWNTVSLGLFDALLGWLLRLPSDVALFVVAVGTVAILTAVRYATTDQDLLRRADEDKKRLGQLIRQARRAGEKDAVRRHKRTKSEIALKKFRAEGKPLLVSLLPIALLATWAMARLGYHPPRPGEAVEVIAYTPVVDAGRVIHIVPTDELQPAEGWVKTVRAVTDQGPPYGEARWRLTGTDAARTYTLVFRLGARSVARPLAVGGTVYAEPVVAHGGEIVTELRMRPVRLFGVVPGIEAIYLPPWLVGYLLIVVPAYAVIRRAFGVH